MTDQSMRDEFEAWAKEEGYDVAYTYDTERSREVWLNPMTADLRKAWQAATRQALERAARVCDERNAFCRQRAQELPQGAELRYMEVCAMLEAGKCADSIRALEG